MAPETIAPRTEQDLAPTLTRTSAPDPANGDFVPLSSGGELGSPTDKPKPDENPASRGGGFEKAAKVIPACALAIGIITVFFYCFVDIQFFPVGMSTGDVLFFSFVSLGLGLVSILAAMFGVMLYLPGILASEAATLGNQARTDVAVQDGQDKSTDRIWFYCLGWALAIGGCIFYAFKASWRSAAGIGFTLAAAFFLACACYWFNGVLKDCRAACALNPNTLGRFESGERWQYRILYLVVTPFMGTLLLSQAEQLWPYLSIVLFAGISAAMLLLMIDVPPTRPVPGGGWTRAQTVTRRRIAIAALCLMMTVPALLSSQVRWRIFTQLGVRIPDAALSLGKENLAVISQAAASSGIPLSVCRTGDADPLVSTVHVLWHGAGSRTWVELVAPRGEHVPPVRVQLDSAGVKVVSGTLERCFDIKDATLFESNSGDRINKSRDVARSELKEILEPLLEYDKRWRLKRLDIYGHADPMIRPGGNHTLAQSRACTVKALIVEGNALPENVIRAQSMGVREPIRQCDTKASVEVQRECNEVNRRVELRLRWEPVNTTSTPHDPSDACPATAAAAPTTANVGMRNLAGR